LAIANYQGEADPQADTAKAIPGGEISLWGAGFPRSLNMWLDVTSFNATVSGLLFEPLLQLHSSDDRWVGVLASTYEVAPDGKTFTFHMDPQARWSDGKPVRAEDVQFYYDVIMDPKNLTPVFKVGLKRLERPVVVDSLTLRIVAKQVHWANFNEAAGLMAFPKHLWAGQDFNKIRFDFPVVSGPYLIKEVRKDRFLLLERRADWWGRVKAYNRGKFNFGAIRYKFSEDQVKALEALKKGDYDLYPIYTAAIWAKQTDFEAVQKGWVARTRIFNRKPIGFQGMAFNLRQPRFQDLRVRRALALLLDRATLNSQLMFSQYFLLNSYYPDLYPGNVNPAVPQMGYAPDAARKLLSEAGWKVDAQGKLRKGGEEFKINFLSASPDLRHLNVYVEALRQVGIAATIEQTSSATVQQRLDDHQFDLHWTAWGGGRLRDPEPAWLSTYAQEKGSNNYPGWSDPYCDSLIKAQMTEFDIAKRNQILLALDARLVDQIPYMLLWQSDNTRLLFWNRFGMPRNPLGKYGSEDDALAYWWVDSAREEALAAARANGTVMDTAATSTVRTPSGDIRYAE
jgi:microcin C transport system substrate-binding protein